MNLDLEDLALLGAGDMWGAYVDELRAGARSAVVSARFHADARKDRSRYTNARAKRAETRRRNRSRRRELARRAF